MEVRMGFWKKTKPENPEKGGYYLSHGEGLREADIEALKGLKAGDRLVIWDNAKDKKTTNSPDLSLAVLKSKVEGAI